MYQTGSRESRLPIISNYILNQDITLNLFVKIITDYFKVKLQSLYLRERFLIKWNLIRIYHKARVSTAVNYSQALVSSAATATLRAWWHRPTSRSSFTPSKSTVIQRLSRSCATARSQCEISFVVYYCLKNSGMIFTAAIATTAWLSR